MYDLARDPVDLPTFKHLIDLARFYKMRFVHVFATAEQGWRLPIPASETVTVPVVFQALVYDGEWTRWWLAGRDRPRRPQPDADAPLQRYVVGDSQRGKPGRSLCRHH